MDTAEMFKALGDSTRLEIVQLLSHGECCACKLLSHFQITQPTLSHHMKILCACGLVVGRKDGKWKYYSLVKEGLTQLSNCIGKLATYDTNT